MYNLTHLCTNFVLVSNWFTINLSLVTDYDKQTIIWLCLHHNYVLTITNILSYRLNTNKLLYSQDLVWVSSVSLILLQIFKVSADNTPETCRVLQLKLFIIFSYLTERLLDHRSFWRKVFILFKFKQSEEFNMIIISLLLRYFSWWPKPLIITYDQNLRYF